MTRGQKTTRFLTGGTLLIGGILALVVMSSEMLRYVVGGIFLLFGLVLMSEKSSKLPGIIILAIGGMFIARNLIPALSPTWIIYVTAICSLFTGAYLTYTGVKRINSY